MCCPFISSPLTHICNKSLKQGIFPAHLKYSVIRPLFKKGDKSNTSTYRPPVIKTKLKSLNFPKEIRNLITEKHKLRRKWHQSRNPHDKNLINRVNQQLSKEIKTIKQSSLTSSSQNSLKTVALSILFGKLQNIYNDQ
jgi:hypothetical protein